MESTTSFRYSIGNFASAGKCCRSHGRIEPCDIRSELCEGNLNFGPKQKANETLLDCDRIGCQRPLNPALLHTERCIDMFFQLSAQSTLKYHVTRWCLLWQNRIFVLIRQLPVVNLTRRSEDIGSYGLPNPWKRSSTAHKVFESAMTRCTTPPSGLLFVSLEEMGSQASESTWATRFERKLLILILVNLYCTSWVKCSFSCHKCNTRELLNGRCQVIRSRTKYSRQNIWEKAIVPRNNRCLASGNTSLNGRFHNTPLK